MKQAVAQEHDFGCGAACVAFVVGVEYREVVAKLGEEAARTKGFWCKDLKRVLNNYGLEYEVKYMKLNMKKRIYTNGAIVFIKRSQRYPYGHYVTYYNGQWMDSWRNLLLDDNIKNAEAGFRRRLPGQPQYALLSKRLVIK